MNTSQPYPYAPWPEYGSEGWLLDEERALRDLLKGMVVTDFEDRTRPVGVWFSHPDQELREQRYPYSTIDLLQIQEAQERVHRGDYYVWDVPEWWGLNPLANGQVGYLLEMPTPIDLDYQISTWSRNPRHDRQILQQMITGGRSMLRAGMLYVADGTRRRLDVLAHNKMDSIEGGKRLFRNNFRIRISSEVPWGSIPYGTSYTRVTKVSTAMDDGTFQDTLAGEVARVHANREVDLMIGGQLATKVPVSRSVVTPFRPGATVSVLQTPKIPNPEHLEDYRLLVLGLRNERRKESKPS